MEAKSFCSLRSVLGFLAYFRTEAFKIEQREFYRSEFMKYSRIKKSIVVWSIALNFIFSPLGVRGEPDETLENSNQNLIEAPGAVLMEKETGTVIYSRDPDTKRSPASITKIMTLILIFDAIRDGRLHLDDTITTSAYAKSMGGSQVYLEEGETQKAETMIKCIVIASGNDASVAMAEHLAGTEQAFVEQMNQRAEKLGMKNTHFVDCCGLTESKDHYTTPYDIALMSRELISRYPEVLTYSSVWMEDITHVTRKGSSKFTLTNTNKLIRQYEYATGLKTGSTGKAKFCVSATASKNGVDLIAVIMGAEDSKSRFKDAVTLLNYGFGKCQIYKAKERKLPVVPVKGGKEDHLKIQYEEGFTYVDTEGSDLSKVEEVTEIPDEVKAPVKKGDTVGRICYRISGKEIGSVNLIASTPVEKADFGDYLKKIWKKLL